MTREVDLLNAERRLFLILTVAAVLSLAMNTVNFLLVCRLLVRGAS